MNPESPMMENPDSRLDQAMNTTVEGEQSKDLQKALEEVLGKIPYSGDFEGYRMSLDVIANALPRLQEAGYELIYNNEISPREKSSGMTEKLPTFIIEMRHGNRTILLGKFEPRPNLGRLSPDEVNKLMNQVKGKLEGFVLAAELFKGQ